VEAILDTLSLLGWSKIGVLSSNENYYRFSAQSVCAACEKRSMSVREL